MRCSFNGMRSLNGSPRVKKAENYKKRLKPNLTQVPRPRRARRLRRRDLHLMSTFWSDRAEPFGWIDLTSIHRATMAHSTIMPWVSLKPPGSKEYFPISQIIIISPHSIVASRESCTWFFFSNNPTRSNPIYSCISPWNNPAVKPYFLIPFFTNSLINVNV